MRRPWTSELSRIAATLLATLLLLVPSASSLLIEASVVDVEELEELEELADDAEAGEEGDGGNAAPPPTSVRAAGLDWPTQGKRVVHRPGAPLAAPTLPPSTRASSPRGPPAV